MSFISEIKNIFTVIFAFFPQWFSTAIISLISFLGVSVGVSLLRKLKDLFWPF